MKNPNPISRAWRIETRRKKLGYPTRCFYCSESEVFCFEEDHPVTWKLDKLFKRVVCRNCHRKLEASRDIKGLTKNGRHATAESPLETARRYGLLLAEDLDSIASMLESPDSCAKLAAGALRSASDSLRRKTNALS